MRPFRIKKYTIAALATFFSVLSSVAQPISISLSSEDVNENAFVPAYVGTLSVFPDTPVTYSIVSGGANFEISGTDILRTLVEFDYESTKTASVTIAADDGVGIKNQDFEITIIDINEAPVLSVIEGDILQYDEEDPPTDITSTIVVADPEDKITSATVSITTGRVNAEDRLDLTSAPFPYTRNYNASSGVLSITGTGTAAEYQTALRDVTYENIEDEDPDEGTRTIVFQVRDGSSFSNTVSRQLKVNGVNDPPVASLVSITGTGAIGDVHTGNYTFSDPEDGIVEGESTYKWYTANDEFGTGKAPISGATAKTYTPGDTQAGKYIQFEVTPVDLDDLEGDPALSSWFPISDLPTATISGNVTICNDGSEGILSVVLTGVAPWAFSYTINGGTKIPVTGIASSPYELSSSLVGTYIVTDVSDNLNDHGLVSGTGTISYYPQVSAILTQSEYYLCDNTTETHELPVILTGTSPWSFSYRRIGDPPADSSVQTSSSTASFIPVTAEDVGVFEILHVWDANCVAEGTGTTEVILRDSPIATLSGDATVCPGEPATLSIELTGTGPWIVSYTRNGGSETTISVPGTTPFTYEYPVSQSGLYELTGVSDTQNEGCAYGSATILKHELPSATISEIGIICQNTDVDVELTGTNP